MWNDLFTSRTKNDPKRNRLDYFIADKVIQSYISSLSKIQSSLERKECFPLYHPDLNDLSVNDILIGIDFDITCVIECSVSFCVRFSLLLTS